MIKLRDIQNKFHNELTSIYSKEEIDNFFYLLTESYFDTSRLQLALNFEAEIDNPETIMTALELLKKEKPIQYILGETEFYGISLKVNEHVLIPRPETEELVNWIIQEFKDQNSELKVLDIGTGSGCIAISLSKNLPNTKVYALDVSKEALKVARYNAELNKVEIQFIEDDILKPKTKDQSPRFDVIVSNPPYVRVREKPLMKANVLDYEPHLALFVEDNNPLLFYKAICEYSKKNLKESGTLLFEINEYLGNEMLQLLKDYNFKSIELKKDIFNKDRMIKGVFSV
ncbi:peptide chain release factor N(5)-glutamine methyltransferase [Seonamhaeicola aphaedonensis]|uniref:Release factor glutamine methyltransferase n=1 Tax=Seonamhaeicola aphaedonensis TaxID=1461338 RepID=A0A3D9HAA6_9FLAO|nr:peptide chain release factor N(5)-glutamine methyltransferase [Seonamhaeicola aphaedonensis]RED45896.1 release factor glutamine methyltransferase [Seonamhaeicola aphaedonensis]